MNPVLRAFLWSTGFVSATVLVMVLLMGWKGNAYGFLSVRVVNDTPRTVRVQPCWDASCNNIVGLHETVIHPGTSERVSGEWVNNFSDEIVMGILTPGAEAMHFNGCLVAFSRPGSHEAVFRVSWEGVCPTSDGGGGG